MSRHDFQIKPAINLLQGSGTFTAPVPACKSAARMQPNQEEVLARQPVGHIQDRRLDPYHSASTPTGMFMSSIAAACSCFPFAHLCARWIAFGSRSHIVPGGLWGWVLLEGNQAAVRVLRGDGAAGPLAPAPLSVGGAGPPFSTPMPLPLVSVTDPDSLKCQNERHRP